MNLTPSSVKSDMLKLGEAAYQASAEIRRARTSVKNAALIAIGEEIISSRDTLMAENEKDLVVGRKQSIRIWHSPNAFVPALGGQVCRPHRCRSSKSPIARRWVN